MAESKFTGFYDYKGFTIWCPSDEWIAEPDWSIEAIEECKNIMPRHSTIAKAKKWVMEVGVNLKEEDFKKGRG